VRVVDPKEEDGQGDREEEHGKEPQRAVDQPHRRKEPVGQRARLERAPQDDLLRLPGARDGELDRISRARGPVHGEERGGRLRQRSTVDRHDHVFGSQPGALGGAAQEDAADPHSPKLGDVAELESQPDRGLEQTLAGKAEILAHRRRQGVVDVQP
jgi:hypothetical protein